MTTAKCAGFVTRAEAGLVKPRSVSRNITPHSGGVGLHYGGERVTINSHADCLRTWKNWQTFHMVSRGWVDIAYTMGVCQHGYVFAGRGAGIRTAANGTNDANQRFYAVCWIGGANMTPTMAAWQAMAWAILQLRESGDAGWRVRNHSDFRSTGCPGPHWRSWSASVDGVRIVLDSQQQAEATDFMDWWESMDKDKQAILEALAEEILARGPEGRPKGTPAQWGRSFAHQTYIFLRQDRKWLEEMDRLIGLGSPGGVTGSTLQGAFVGGLNCIDAVRDLGYKISTTKRTGATRG